jgi:hypothetical protein
MKPRIQRLRRRHSLMTSMIYKQVEMKWSASRNNTSGISAERIPTEMD